MSVSLTELLNRYTDLQEAFDLSLTLKTDNHRRAENLIVILGKALDELLRIISITPASNRGEAIRKITLLENPRALKLFDEKTRQDMISQCRQFGEREH